MGEAKVILTAEDKASTIIDGVTRHLGMFSKEGLGLGITLALVNKAIDMAMQALGDLNKYVSEGVELNRQNDLQMTRLITTVKDLGMAYSQVEDNLRGFSVAFGVSLQDVTSGFQSLVREGYNAVDAMTLLFQTLRMSTVTGDDLTSTEDALISVLHSFNLTAADSGYAMGLLNTISSTTGLSMSELSRILGNVAGSLQTSGVSLQTFTDLLYTLHEQGYSSRAILTQLKTTLDSYPSNLPSLKTPAGDIPTLETKLERIGATAALTASQMKSLGTLSQMDLTKGLDLGSYFDKDTINYAKELFNTLNTEGVTTLEKFNQAAARKNENIWDSTLEGMPGTSSMQQLIRSMYAYNDSVAASDDPVANLVARLTDLGNEMTNDQAKITADTQKLIDLRQAVSDLTATKQWTVSLHDATQAVQSQQDAISQLQYTQDGYNQETLRNSLAMNELLYNHPRMTRGVQRQLDALRRDNLRILIEEQRNQVQIGDIQLNGLHTAQEALDAVKRAHDAYMYARELADLDTNIKAQEALYWSTYTDQVTLTQKVAELQQAARATELAETQGWSREMRMAFEYAYTGHVASGSSHFDFTGSVLGSRAGGGYIPQTGPYLLHQGETVVPSNTTYGGDRVNVVNNFYPTQKLTRDELRSLLASASDSRIIGRGSKVRTRTR